MLADAGIFLKRRKERLDRVRHLRRERRQSESEQRREANEAAYVGRLEEERLLKRQREELRQVQEMLAASERRQLGRTLKTRAFTAASWCMIVIAAMAVGSWFAANNVWPAPSVASVDLVAKMKDGEKMSPEADAVWEGVHRDALKDDAFRQIVVRRLQERGLSALGGASEINGWIDRVRFDSDGPGSFRMIAAAPDAESARVALDTLATSLANESAHLLKGRSEFPKAMIAGSAAAPGRLTFSTLVPQSTPTDRLTAAAMLFSGVAGLGIAAALALYSRLSRAKRKFEEMGAV
jgi:hypothetical protein